VNDSIVLKIIVGTQGLSGGASMTEQVISPSMWAMMTTQEIIDRFLIPAFHATKQHYEEQLAGASK
jgi:hypothetical protein